MTIKSKGGGSRRSRSSTASFPTFPFLLALYGLLVAPVDSQIGVTLCACFPPLYEFTLNFASLCSESNVEGPGIENIECFVQGTTPGENITDETPVDVSSIEVLELDDELAPLSNTFYTDGYRNGSKILYTSIATWNNLTIDFFPEALQLNIVATNALDQALLQVWVIRFTNECGIFPLLSIGEQMGWTTIVSVRDFALDLLRRFKLLLTLFWLFIDQH